MNKKYGGLVSNPRNTKDTQVVKSITYTTNGTVVETVNLNAWPAATESDTPSSPLISLWANEACTERPVVGQEYETVYAKISRTIPSGDDIRWGDESEDFTTFFVLFSPETHTTLAAWIDWYLDIPRGDVSPGVYPLTLPGGYVLEAPLVTDFDL